MLKPGSCGDDCNICPRYMATKEGDEKRLQEVAGMWQIVGWRHSEEPPENYVCRGCATIKTCGLGIKECVMEKGIDSCGKCSQYPCEKMLKTFENNKKEAVICREKFSKADCDLFQKAFFSKKERLDKIHREYFGDISGIKIERAYVGDAAEILKLQKLAYLSEGAIYNDYNIPPLTQTLKEVKQDFKEYFILKATVKGVIIGSVRGTLTPEGDCYIARLMVHPDFQKRGIGTRLMGAIEAEFPQVKRYTLGTGHRSESNLRLYQKLGYNPYNSEPLSDKVTIVHLEKIKK